ncbi:MAG: aquaporin [Pseudomonadota bacterium]
MKKLIAEGIGTFALVFFGCGTALFMSPEMGEAARLVGISFAFGLSVVAMAYGLGPISGAHLNPAVSIGVFLSGGMAAGEMIGYWVAQIVGGLVASMALMAMTVDPGAASTMVSSYGLTAALIFEFVATFLFVTVILGATQQGHATAVAGLAIGLTLVLIHLTGIPVTGTSVNPARSIATNVFNAEAMAQLWIFLLAPLAGGALAGILHKAGITRAD